ncbi:MAG: hypothetical protein FWE11_08885 [Defluviitaleaceae bacterium]|nr:hypothetical protein [Defluviitaleaceae bacterium]
MKKYIKHLIIAGATITAALITGIAGYFSYSAGNSRGFDEGINQGAASVVNEISIILGSVDPTMQSVEVISQEITEHQADLTRLQEQLLIAEQELEQIAEFQNQIDGLISENDALKEEIRLLVEQNTEQIREYEDHIAALEAENAELRIRISANTSGNNVPAIGNRAIFWEEVPPFESNHVREPNVNVLVAGNRVENALEFRGGASAWTRHNLNNQYRILNAYIGRLDGTRREQSTFIFFGDGREIYRIIVGVNDMPRSFTLNVEGVVQLMIEQHIHSRWESSVVIFDAWIE